MNNKFTCPNCKTQLPFKALFSFKKEPETICPNCHGHLLSHKTISWVFGFLIGFLGVAIPGYIVMERYKNFLVTGLTGVVAGIIAILTVAIYTYLTTEFKIKD